MTFSLTHYLDFNILILAMFPWAKGYLVEKRISRATFSSSFISTSIFLFVYMYITKTDYVKRIFSPVTFNEFLMAIIVSLLCIGMEFIIFILKYKKITFLKVENDSFLIFTLLTIIIPIVEEFVFRGCIYSICDGYFNTYLPFILCSSIGFGLNHIIYPKINIFTKFLWGIFIGLEFIYSNSLVCCIISHILCNLFIYFMGKKGK